jgi:feruloyl esterase
MKILKSFQIIFIALVILNTSFAQIAIEPTKTPCTPCEKIKNIRLPDVIISQIEQIQEPAPHCKISGIIGSEINFELLLPNIWNSRFTMGGGGGFVGSVQNMARSSISKGYASAGTDTGHQSNGLKADWAFNNMERQVNFGHLAVHRTVVTSKEIIRKYYCSDIAYSYFIGCSRGGGQAMMEAQRYPEDFDGIVAGAPAFNWPAIGAEFVQNIQAIYPNPEQLHDPVITLSNLKLLHNIVLAQCDALDGLEDQILNDPTNCDLDFNALPKCPDNSPSSDCFTSNQIEAIRIVYSGVSDEHKEIYPGFPQGGENEPGGWQPWITGPDERTMALNFPSLQFGFGTEMFKYLIFQDSTWDYSSYDFSNFLTTTQYASSYLDATSTDYGEFKQSGSKMIIYHGWNDPALSAFATINHYNQVKNGDPNVKDYLRLFLLPGVLHCGGGPGPSDVDWIELARNWVENGTAPDRVVLSKIDEEKVIMTRPVFPYPEKAIYDGNGDPNMDSSFRTASQK